MALGHGWEGRLVRRRRSRPDKKAGERSAEPVLLRSPASVRRAGRNFPPGPSFISSLWVGSGGEAAAAEGEAEDSVPSLVVAVITRETPWGALIPGFVLVDRTCLGVKGAAVGAPRTRAALDVDLAALAADYGPLTECPLLVAQSVIFNAVDYAGSLGFEPHGGFQPEFFGPRPEALLDTPFARPAYPIYIVGPGDPVEEILETLDQAVGEFNYAFMPGAPPSSSRSAFADEGAPMDEEEAMVG